MGNVSLFSICWKWNLYWRARQEIFANVVWKIMLIPMGDASCVIIDSSDNFLTGIFEFSYLCYYKAYESARNGELFHRLSFFWNEIHFDTPDMKSFCEQIVIKTINMSCDNRFFRWFCDGKFWIFISLVLWGVRKLLKQEKFPLFKLLLEMKFILPFLTRRVVASGLHVHVHLPHFYKDMQLVWQ